MQEAINSDRTVAGGGKDMILAGRYHILRQLGQGGMGAVWLAEDRQLDNRKVAIKMLPSIIVTDKRSYNQLKGEALVSLKLVHPNIVTLRAFEENNGAPFLVMDYIDGRPLSDYLAVKGKLSEAETIKLLKPIADALDYAHGEKVIHRDVKPSNIIIRKDGHPFILDFGIAREIHESMTRVTGGTISGTLLYMAPEQLRGAPPKPAQDVYSFSAMAYECLSGRPPFIRGQIEYQIINERPAPLLGKSQFVAAIMAGLAKKPEDRPKSCSAVLGRDDFSSVEHAEHVEHVERVGSRIDFGSRKANKGGGTKPTLWVVGVALAVAVIVLFNLKTTSSNKNSMVAERKNEYAVKPIERSKMRKESKVEAKHEAREGEHHKIGDNGGEHSSFAKEPPSTTNTDFDHMSKEERIATYQEEISKSDQTQSHTCTTSMDYKPSTRERLIELEHVIKRMKVDTGRYPDSLKELQTMYGVGSVRFLQDEWGTEIYYETDGYDYGLSSAGPDKQWESPDDIVIIRRGLADLETFEKKNVVDQQHTLGLNSSNGDRVLTNGNESVELNLKAAEQGNVVAQRSLGFMYQKGRGVMKDMKEAMKWYRRAAEQGDAKAQNALGDLYADGLGVPIDYSEALKWYCKAEKLGDSDAQRNIGLLYEIGLGVAKDEKTSINWYRKSASQGNAIAQLALGKMLEDGRGATKDESEAKQMYGNAIKWFREAAASGSDEAQLYLAEMYENGHGVVKNESVAVNWYRKAAEQGNAFAQNNLGRMYRSGRGVPKDDEQAVKWYRMAADQGYVFAQNNIGRMYASGRGVPKNDAEAVKWYRKAAEHGCANAQYDLGWMYSSGRGVTKDDVEAAKWCQKAAEQGHVKAQAVLGVLYKEGLGIAKDFSEAVKWYRKAANGGDVLAQMELGDMYANGLGVAKDGTEAAKWYRKAADSGDVLAQMKLGDMYANGLGVAKDGTEAAKWYRKAADSGDVLAQCTLGLIYEGGSGVAKDEAEAAKWYRKAADSGDKVAQFRLGVMYADGRGVVKDDNKSVIWYRKAAEQEYAIAEYYLGEMYASGRGVMENYAEAIKWCGKAAEHGDALAQYTLGMMYANGLGVAKSDTEAVKWYRKAAKQGNEEAQRALRNKGLGW